MVQDVPPRGKLKMRHDLASADPVGPGRAVEIGNDRVGHGVVNRAGVNARVMGDEVLDQRTVGDSRDLGARLRVSGEQSPMQCANAIDVQCGQGIRILLVYKQGNTRVANECQADWNAWCALGSGSDAGENGVSRALAGRERQAWSGPGYSSVLQEEP